MNGLATLAVAVPMVGVSLVGLVLVVFLALAVLALARKHPKTVIFGGLLFGVLLLLFTFAARVRHVEVVEARARAEAKVAAARASRSTGIPTPLIEEWELLNKPEIELEENAVEPTVTETAATQEVDEASEPDQAEEPGETGSAEDDAAEAEETETEAPSSETKKAEAADRRPEWVDSDYKMVGHVVRRVIHSGPYKTVEECRLALEPMIAEAVRKRVRRLATTTPGSATHDVPPVSEMGIGLGYIFRDLCVDDYVEDYEASIGDMKKVHVLMEFRPAEDEFLLGAYQKYQRRQSLWVVAAFSTLAVSVVAAAYGLLKIDTWSRGYYTQRLLLGGGGAILVLVAIGIMIAL
ncbi:MAG: hypothetical protein AAGA92_00345 [Planctomycetota bacterium]